MSKLKEALIWITSGTFVLMGATALTVPFIIMNDDSNGEIPNTNEKPFISAKQISITSTSANFDVTIKQPNSKWMIKKVNFNIINKDTGEIVFSKNEIALPEIPEYEKSVNINTNSNNQQGKVLEQSTEYNLVASYTFYDSSKPAQENVIVNGGSFRTLDRSKISLAGPVTIKESFDSLGLEFEINRPDEEIYHPTQFKVDVFNNIGDIDNPEYKLEKSSVFNFDGVNNLKYSIDIDNLKPNKEMNKYKLYYSNKDLDNKYEFLAEGNFNTLIVPFSKIEAIENTANINSRDLEIDLNVSKYKEEDGTMDPNQDIEKMKFYIKDVEQDLIKWDSKEIPAPTGDEDVLKYHLKTNPGDDFIRNLDSEKEYELYTTYTRVNGEIVEDEFLYQFKTEKSQKPTFDKDSINSLRSWNQFEAQFKIENPSDDFYSIKDDKLLIKLWDNEDRKGSPLEEKEIQKNSSDEFYRYKTTDNLLSPNTEYWWDAYYDDEGDDITGYTELIASGNAETRVADKGKVIIDESVTVADERNVEFAFDIEKPNNPPLSKMSERELWVKSIQIAISEDGDDPNKGKDHRIWLKDDYVDIYKHPDRFGDNPDRLLGFTRGVGEKPGSNPSDNGDWHLHANTKYGIWVKTTWENDSIATEDEKKFILQDEFTTKAVEQAKVEFKGNRTVNRTTMEVDFDVHAPNYVSNKMQTTSSNSERIDNVGNTEVYDPSTRSEYISFKNPYSVEKLNLEIRKKGEDEIVNTATQNVNLVAVGGGTQNFKIKIDNLELNKEYDLYLQIIYRGTDKNIVDRDSQDMKFVDTVKMEEKEVLEPGEVKIDESKIETRANSVKFSVIVGGPKEKEFGSAVKNIYVGIKENGKTDYVWTDKREDITQPNDDLELNEVIEFDTGDNKLDEQKEYVIDIEIEYYNSIDFPSEKVENIASFKTRQKYTQGEATIDKNIDAHVDAVNFSVRISPPWERTITGAIKQISIEIREINSNDHVWLKENYLVEQPGENLELNQLIEFSTEKKTLNENTEYEIFINADFNDSILYPSTGFISKAKFKTATKPTEEKGNVPKETIFVKREIFGYGKKDERDYTEERIHVDFDVYGMSSSSKNLIKDDNSGAWIKNIHLNASWRGENQQESANIDFTYSANNPMPGDYKHEEWISNDFLSFNDEKGAILYVELYIEWEDGVTYEPETVIAIDQTLWSSPWYENIQ